MYARKERAATTVLLGFAERIQWFVQLTYFGMLGHESCNLIQYLEAFEGVAPIKRGHNPATWMLEVTGGATSNNIKASQQDFPAVYKVRLSVHTHITYMCIYIHIQIVVYYLCHI